MERRHDDRPRTLPGGSYSTPYFQQNTSLNNRGEVVGYADTAAGEKHAFLWSEGTMIDLGAPQWFRLKLRRCHQRP